MMNAGSFPKLEVSRCVNGDRNTHTYTHACITKLGRTTFIVWYAPVVCMCNLA